MTFAFPDRVHPKPGRFYRSKAGEVWACFRAHSLLKNYGEHTQSWCFRVPDHILEYFLDDRSFDPGGEIDQELTEEVSEEDTLMILKDWRSRRSTMPP